MNSSDSLKNFSSYPCPASYHRTDGSLQESIPNVYFIQPSTNHRNEVQQAGDNTCLQNDQASYAVAQPPPYSFSCFTPRCHLRRQHYQQQQRTQRSTASESYPANLEQLQSLQVTVQPPTPLFNHDQLCLQSYIQDLFQPTNNLHSLQSTNTNNLLQQSYNTDHSFGRHNHFDQAHLDPPPPYSVGASHHHLQQATSDIGYYNNNGSAFCLTDPESGRIHNYQFDFGRISNYQPQPPINMDIISMNQGRQDLCQHPHIQQSAQKRSYTGVIVLSCIVFWLMFPPLGLAAFILAVLAKKEEGEGRSAKAYKYSRYSRILSGIAIIIGIIIIIAAPIILSAQLY